MNTTPKSPLTDDELGALLGDSVRGRVDAVPTITPSFDGVERRARQITNRRRAAAGLAVGALALFGGLGATALFSDDEGAIENDVVTEPNPDPEPAPDTDSTDGDADPTPDTGEEPDVVDDPVLPIGTADYTLTAIIDGTRFIGVDAEAGTETDLIDASETGEQLLDAVMLADESVLTWVDDSSVVRNEIVRHYPTLADAPVVLSSRGRLAGGAVIDGVPYAFVNDYSTEQFGTGDLRAVDLRTYESTIVLADASGPESAIVSVDVRGDSLLIEQASEGGPAWFIRNLDGSDPGFAVRFPGGAPDTVWAFSPRFDRTGSGLLWLELDTTTDVWSLVRSDRVDGPETARFPIDLGPAAGELFFTLEVTDELMVANRTGSAIDAALDVTTIWISPQATFNGVVEQYGFSAESEAGIVKFIEAPESSVIVEPGDDVGDAPALTDWMDPEALGILNIESDADIRDAGPIVGPMVGLDSDGVVWVATPLDDGRTVLADLWLAEGARAVRYLNDPTDPASREFVFDLGERIVHVNADDQARVIADAAHLVGAEIRFGRPTAYVVDLPIARGGAVEVGDLHMIDLLTGESITVFEGLSTETTEVRDVQLGDSVTFVEVSGDGTGSTLLGANPSTALVGFGDADAAALSSDGTTISWIDQVGVTAGFQPELALTVASVDTGAATEPVTILLPPSQVALDYDLVDLGEQLLLIRSWPGGLDGGRQTTDFAAALLIDPMTGDTTELGLPAAAWKPVAN